MPDADLDMTAKIVSDSAFGCAGQRCLAAPMAYFPFSGWRDSFMGVLHGQGKDAIEFYTGKKVVIERWPKEWTRKF